MELLHAPCVLICNMFDSGRQGRIRTPATANQFGRIARIRCDISIFRDKRVWQAGCNFKVRQEPISVAPSPLNPGGCRHPEEVLMNVILSQTEATLLIAPGDLHE